MRSIKTTPPTRRVGCSRIPSRGLTPRKSRRLSISRPDPGSIYTEPGSLIAAWARDCRDRQSRAEAGQRAQGRHQARDASQERGLGREIEPYAGRNPSIHSLRQIANDEEACRLAKERSEGRCRRSHEARGYGLVQHPAARTAVGGLELQAAIPSAIDGQLQRYIVRVPRIAAKMDVGLAGVEPALGLPAVTGSAYFRLMMSEAASFRPARRCGSLR